MKGQNGHLNWNRSIGRKGKGDYCREGSPKRGKGKKGKREKKRYKKKKKGRRGGGNSKVHGT